MRLERQHPSREKWANWRRVWQGCAWHDCHLTGQVFTRDLRRHISKASCFFDFSHHVVFILKFLERETESVIYEADFITLLSHIVYFRETPIGCYLRLLEHVMVI